MTQPPEFPNYRQEAADAMLASTDLISEGLMGYLGIRHVSFGPGTMVAELDVREELLTPFGTAHGGVVSALADHVLGSMTRRTAVVRIDITNGDRLCAAAQGTVSIQDPR